MPFTFFRKIFARKYIVRWFVIGGVVLLVAAWGVWWCKLSITPERVFWGMIDQSFTTSGVTLSSTIEKNGAQLTQSMQFSLGGQNRSLTQTTVKQNGAEVTTEVVGTLDADYTRYAHIKTEQLNAQGQPLDISKVLNVWAKADNVAGSQSLDQAVLGLNVPFGSIPVPIGSLTAKQRSELVQQIKNEGVYETSFSKAKREVKNGRVRYTYDVKVQTIPYVHLLKEFAKRVGMHDLDQLDPNNYQGMPLTLQLTVDARSRHLVEVYMPETDFRQTFAAYDVPVATPVPTDTVTVQELQKRLNEL